MESKSNVKKKEKKFKEIYIKHSGKMQWKLGRGSFLFGGVLGMEEGKHTEG